MVAPCNMDDTWSRRCGQTDRFSRRVHEAGEARPPIRYLWCANLKRHRAPSLRLAAWWLCKSPTKATTVASLICLKKDEQQNERSSQKCKWGEEKEIWHWEINLLFFLPFNHSVSLDKVLSQKQDEREYQEEMKVRNKLHIHCFTIKKEEDKNCSFCFKNEHTSCRFMISQW